MSTPEPDPTLSRDATHSTYGQAPPSDDPTAGPGVIQTLGTPAEEAAPKAKTTTAKKTT
jgi:hypothetical protein